MSKENRMKIVLSLLGISFPVVGGILSVYVEDCGVLLLIGGITGMTFCLAWAFKVFWLPFLFAHVLCPAIFFGLNPHAFEFGPSKEWKEACILIQREKIRREKIRDNWNNFIARYVENRAWGIGMFKEEDVKAIIAESCQRECRRRESEGMRDKLENEANDGRKRDWKPWWWRREMLYWVGVLLYLSLKEMREGDSQSTKSKMQGSK